MGTGWGRRGARWALATGAAMLAAACGGGGSGATDPAAAAPTATDATAAEAVEKAVLPVAPVAPLQLTGVPDVNAIGLLEGRGGWPKITEPQKQVDLQRMGKALFWDMQVGGDGIQACATCHYHAGADHRKVNQVSPGFKSGDVTLQLTGLNGTLGVGHYLTASGLPARDAASAAAAGSNADTADGTPGSLRAPLAASDDVNDVVSSQGTRYGTYTGLGDGRVDGAVLKSDPLGFNQTLGAYGTVRRVEPRNSPTVLNAVYNLRNFWDGRADMFFNGVSPLGFRDDAARVKVVNAAGDVVDGEPLRIPFSSLASQAVGPIGSTKEMIVGDDTTTGTRPLRDLGRKLTRAGTVPLAGQLVDPTDSLFGPVAARPAISTATRVWPGSPAYASIVATVEIAPQVTQTRGLTTTYAAWVRSIFDRRFWGDANGNDVCVSATGTKQTAVDGACPEYTLMQYNFPLFFGLAVQAYEATLTTENTIVDLIAGGIATGTLTLGRKTLDVAGVALDGCVAGLAAGAAAAPQAAATRFCSVYYASFIAQGMTSGAQSDRAPTPVPPHSPIDGCAPLRTVTNGANLPATLPQSCQRAIDTLSNVNRGLGRFTAGATQCSFCHLNAEFTGATVSALTGFGIGPELLPPGQARRAERRAVMERMPTFNGAAAVYDSGFYNIGVRPTPEDLSLGEAIGGVPLSLAKFLQVAAGGAGTLGSSKTDPSAAIDDALVRSIAPKIGALRIPTQPNNLAAQPFPWAVGCGVGLVGGGNANNNPNVNCNPAVLPTERLLRNGAFKAPGLRNVKFTGPYMHNGGMMTLDQVFEFYSRQGHFPVLNFNNLDAGIRQIGLDPADRAALVEMMETGLTDWNVAFKRDRFDHPELCLPNGHDPATGRTVLVGVPAVGRAGTQERMQTFEEQLQGTTVSPRGRPFANALTDACTVLGVGTNRTAPISSGGLSTIDHPAN